MKSAKIKQEWIKLSFDLQIVEPEEVVEKTGLGYLHTAHCLGSGEIMISAMGSPEGKEEGTSDD